MATDAALSGRTAIVTGASSGIGRAIAEKLGCSGAAVHLVGRTAEAMAASVVRIREAGGNATAAVLDVIDSEALETFVHKVAADAGGLDVMVNNAGVARSSTILEENPVQWREMLDVNLLAVLVGSRAAVAAMRQTGSRGHIINVSSTAALQPGFSTYGATKAAVSYLTEELRREVEADDIRVTTLLPGPVATNAVRNFDPEVVQRLMQAAGRSIEFVPGKRLPDEILHAVQAALQPFVARPEDIADAVFYVLGLPARLSIPELVVRPTRTLPL